jgi:hypothetical protein
MASIGLAQLEQQSAGKSKGMEQLGILLGRLSIAVRRNTAPNQIIECLPQLNELNLIN